MIRRATADDVEEIARLYERSFADEIGTGVGHALFEYVKTLRPEGFQFWVFQQNERERRFYEARGAVAVEFTDGEHNEKKTPDVRYEWKPSA